MAFVAASSLKDLKTRQYPVRSRASGDGPDTAQYGLVLPNEWPNGESAVNLPIIMAAALWTTVLLIVLGLLADTILGLLDPRVRGAAL